MHPLYDPARIVNDVALLKLSSTVPLTLNMKPICLPERNNNFDGLNVSELRNSHYMDSGYRWEASANVPNPPSSGIYLEIMECGCISANSGFRRT